LSSNPPIASAPEQGAHVPYIRAIRAHPLLVIAIVLVAVVAAVAIEKSHSPSYEATAHVLVTPVSNGGPYVGLPVVTETANDPSRTLQTATSVLKSPAAAQQTAAELHGHWSAQTVSEAISIEPLGESSILSITGTAGTASQALAVANTYTHRALTRHIAQLAGEAKADIEQLQARQKGIATGEAGQIATTLTALSSVAAGHDPNFSLLQDAALPAAASGTSTKVIAVLALLAGLIVAIAAVTGIEYLNRRVSDEDELLSLYPLPVLARIPILPRGARQSASLGTLPPRVREAYRTLQIQIPAGVPGGGRVVMFASASPRDGKTASAVGFALVLASAGFRVVLLDFDLRKPAVQEYLRVDAREADLAREDASLRDLLVEVPSAPGLWVAGTPQREGGRPAIDVAHRHLPVLLSEGREMADYVIIDTPPIGQVSDAISVATAADDVILVARPGNTDREELKRTRELLDRMALTPAGLIVIGDPKGGNVYAEYGAGEAATAQHGLAASPRGASREAQGIGSGRAGSGSLERPRRSS
jgi:Mrp family chromosome partitioning ATPase